MGYSVELDSSQQLILTQQPGLLTVVDDQKKPSPALLVAWRQVVDAGVEEQKRLETKSSGSSLWVRKKPNHSKKQSSLPLAPKPSTSVSDHKHEQKEQLQGVVNSIALQGISFLQASTQEFTQSWQALMEQERESFYKQFERYYLQSEETQWVLYFQDTIGIFFQPLPSLTQPWPAWWFKHATQNRNLLFES